MARRSEGQGLRSMLAVDLRRMFTTPLFYILLGLSAAIPVLILVMTTMMAGTVTVDPNTGVESVAEGFDSVWQIIGSLSGSSAAGEMDMTSMCNINLVYFLAAVLVCVFMADDFRSGFAKGLFALRPGKGGYAASKTAVCALCGMLLLAAFFLGAMAGGRMAGLSFAPLAGMNWFSLICCLLAKLLLMLVFVPIFVVMGAIGKARLWLSILLSVFGGMLLFMMVSMMTPLNAYPLHPLLCLAGGAMFSLGLGKVTSLVLAHSDLI